MMMLVHFVHEYLIVIKVSFFIYLFQTAVGFGFVYRFLPRTLSWKWPVIAPFAGLALEALILVPTGILGIPILTSRYLVLMVSGLFTIDCAIHSDRSPLPFNRMMRYVKLRGARLMACFLTVAAITTILMTPDGASVRDLWGTTDFYGYWTLGDYLQKYGANVSDYFAQHEYRGWDMENQLIESARLGGLSSLSFVGSFTFPGETYRIVNFYIIHALYIWVGLLQFFLDRQRVHASWPLWMCCLHPFLYFLFYYSYLSQAISVPLAIFSCWIFSCFCQRLELPQIRWSEATGTGLILASTFFFYASLSPQVMLACAIIAWGHRRQLEKHPLALKKMVTVILVALSGLLVYGSSIYSEIAFMLHQRIVGGWEWTIMPGFSQFLGIGPLLGFVLPKLDMHFAWLTNAFGFSVVAVLFGLGWRQWRDAWFVFGLAAGFFVMMSMAVQKVISHTPHGTMAVAKILSQEALFWFALLLVPIALHYKIKHLPVWLKLSLTIWMAALLTTTLKAVPRRAYFSESAVALVRRTLLKQKPLAIVWVDFGQPHPCVAEAFVKNRDWVLPYGENTFWTYKTELDRLLFVSMSYFGTASTVFDSDGKAELVLPPSCLRFYQGFDEAWVFCGNPTLFARPQPKLSSMVCALGKPSHRLVMEAEVFGANQRNSPLKLDLFLDDQLVLTEEVTTGQVHVSAPVPSNVQSKPFAWVKVLLRPRGNVTENQTAYMLVKCLTFSE